MTKPDIFLSFVSKKLEEKLQELELSEMEKLSIRISILDIFEQNYDLEQIYYEILDYFEDYVLLAPLISDVEKYYLSA